MPHTVKQLGQLRPADTTAASLWSPGAGEEIVMHTLFIANRSAVSADYTLYYDDDGAVFDDDSVIVPATTLTAGKTYVLQVQVSSNQSAANFGVKTSVADAINFMAFGEVFT